MTVDTPFSSRPGLPWLVRFRPTPLEGLADFQLPNGQPCDPGVAGPNCQDTATRVVRGITSDLTQVFRVLHEDEPGMYTVQMADGSLMTYRQPAGSNQTLPVGSPLYGAGAYGYGPSVSAGVSGSSTGLLIAAAVVAALFFFGGRR